MSRFLSITNFDELKMVPEGQIHAQWTFSTVVVGMFCCVGMWMGKFRMFRKHLLEHLKMFINPTLEGHPWILPVAVAFLSVDVDTL